MSKKRRLPLLVLVLVLVFTLSACTPNTPNAKNNLNNTKQNTNISNTNVVHRDIKVEPKEVSTVFMGKYPNAGIYELELELEDGSYIYEVKGYDSNKKYELKVNSVDGSIIKEKVVPNEGAINKGKLVLEDVDKIQELIDRTVGDAGKDYKIKEWNLKHKNGLIIFTVEMLNDKNQEIEYKYDVNTGELLEKERD